MKALQRGPLYQTPAHFARRRLDQLYAIAAQPREDPLCSFDVLRVQFVEYLGWLAGGCAAAPPPFLENRFAKCLKAWAAAAPPPQWTGGAKLPALSDVQVEFYGNLRVFGAPDRAALRPLRSYAPTLADGQLHLGDGAAGAKPTSLFRRDSAAHVLVEEYRVMCPTSLVFGDAAQPPLTHTWRTERIFTGRESERLRRDASSQVIDVDDFMAGNPHYAAEPLRFAAAGATPD